MALSASTASCVASHSIYPRDELTRPQDDDASPRRHACEVGVLGHDEERAHLHREVQHQIVFMVRAVVHRSGSALIAIVTGGFLTEWRADNVKNPPVVMVICGGGGISGDG